MRCLRWSGGLAILALVDLVACGPAPVAPDEIVSRLAAVGPPNVVLVVVDTLRADFTTPYGFERDTTPELARWAARGVLFEQTRAQSSWTKISMASLMTSRWPSSNGIHDARDGLGDEATTLAEVLREAGYATYGVQSNGWLHQSFGFHQGFDRYMFPKGGGHAKLGQAALWPHADRVFQEAVRLIDAHDGSRPFFLYLHFMDVHEYASPPSYQIFGSDQRGAYLNAIRWVDDTLKRIREKLEKSGHADRTLMVLAADHGETFGETGVYGHARNVLTPVVSVPLILRFPFEIEGLRVATQVRNVDIAPTLLELVGVDRPRSFEGRSLAPLLVGDAAESDRPSFAALGVPLFPDASVQTSTSDGVWTFARNAEDSGSYTARAREPGAEFLYDRRIDPAEDVNLVDLEPDQAARMRRALDEHLASAGRPVAERGVRIDPGIANRLRAMGYLQ